ncbi:hypothetical protein M427DRAFT_32991 [Gonapodya prolifera JEL478]|uniref:Uncharacterized protein n=1 Tax=Gonapodya prolifera (strain JEL478) TaxID=1344416 RepID=A0A139ACM7_GONPJ|nr:hypothetical protein M427DRAFT_32991 [Gonapodya prolifera JEL478]|eukprot:KXS14527.1 hypothetical protein M427DRAFT_32991 [Gonapodya prolifera JEL478]
MKPLGAPKAIAASQASPQERQILIQSLLKKWSANDSPRRVKLQRIKADSYMDIRPLYREGVEEIKASIRKNSLLETTPFILLELDDGFFAVVDGRHHLNALLELRVEGAIAIDGLDDLEMEITVVVLKADTPEQEQRLIRRNLNYIGEQTVPMTPFDTLRAVLDAIDAATLKNKNWTHEDVIEMLPGAGSAAQLKNFSLTHFAQFP